MSTPPCTRHHSLSCTRRSLPVRHSTPGTPRTSTWAERPGLAAPTPPSHIPGARAVQPTSRASAAPCCRGAHGPPAAVPPLCWALELGLKAWTPPLHPPAPSAEPAPPPLPSSLCTLTLHPLAQPSVLCSAMGPLRGQFRDTSHTRAVQLPPCPMRLRPGPALHPAPPPAKDLRAALALCYGTWAQ